MRGLIELADRDWDKPGAESAGHLGNTPVEVQALPPGAGQANTVVLWG